MGQRAGNMLGETQGNIPFLVQKASRVAITFCMLDFFRNGKKHSQLATEANGALPNGPNALFYKLFLSSVQVFPQTPPLTLLEILASRLVQLEYHRYHQNLHLDS